MFHLSYVSMIGLRRGTGGGFGVGDNCYLH